MKKIFLCILFFIIIGFSLSCGETSRDPLFYQRGAFESEIEIQKNGIRIGATLSASESGDVSLVLTSPSSVAGTEIKRKDGALSVTRGELSFDLSDASAFFAAAELFMLEGEVASAEICELDGVRYTKLLVLSGGEPYEIYLNGDGSPRRISSPDLSVDVIWFENG